MFMQITAPPSNVKDELGSTKGGIKDNKINNSENGYEGVFQAALGINHSVPIESHNPKLFGQDSEFSKKIAEAPGVLVLDGFSGNTHSDKGGNGNISDGKGAVKGVRLLGGNLETKGVNSMDENRPVNSYEMMKGDAEPQFINAEDLANISDGRVKEFLKGKSIKTLNPNDTSKNVLFDQGLTINEDSNDFKDYDNHAFMEGMDGVTVNKDVSYIKSGPFLDIFSHNVKDTVGETHLEDRGGNFVLDASGKVLENVETGRIQTSFDGHLESVPVKGFEQSVPIQLGVKMSAMFKKGMDKAVIRLEPPSLGRLKLDISVKDSIVHAHVTAENAVVKGLIESNVNLLKNTLSEQGLNLGAFSVFVGDGSNAFKEDPSDTANDFMYVDGKNIVESLSDEMNGVLISNAVDKGSGRVNIFI